MFATTLSDLGEKDQIYWKWTRQMVPSKLWQAAVTLFLVFSRKTKNATSPGFYKYSIWWLFWSIAVLSYILGMGNIEVALDPRPVQLPFDRVAKFWNMNDGIGEVHQDSVSSLLFSVHHVVQCRVQKSERKTEKAEYPMKFIHNLYRDCFFYTFQSGTCNLSQEGSLANQN